MITFQATNKTNKNIFMPKNSTCHIHCIITSSILYQKLSKKTYKKLFFKKRTKNDPPMFLI